MSAFGQTANSCWGSTGDVWRGDQGMMQSVVAGSECKIILPLMSRRTNQQWNLGIRHDAETMNRRWDDSLNLAPSYHFVNRFRAVEYNHIIFSSHKILNPGEVLESDDVHVLRVGRSLLSPPVNQVNQSCLVLSSCMRKRADRLPCNTTWAANIQVCFHFLANKIALVCCKS